MTVWEREGDVLVDVEAPERRASADDLALAEESFDYLGPDPNDPESGERWGEYVVLGRCPHGVDLDREFCPRGCRV